MLTVSPPAEKRPLLVRRFASQLQHFLALIGQMLKMSEEPGGILRADWSLNVSAASVIGRVIHHSPTFPRMSLPSPAGGEISCGLRAHARILLTTVRLLYLITDLTWRITLT